MGSNSKSVLVCGAGGFIGAHLVCRLKREGAWVRGVQAASTEVSSNYQPESARLLRQPAIIEYLIARIDVLPERLKTDELVGKVRNGLIEIKASVAPMTPPSADTVKSILKTTTSLVDSISGPAVPAP